MRELKARYRASVLGFLWTFLNPTLNMIVYVLVFGILMQQRGAALPVLPLHRAAAVDLSSPPRCGRRPASISDRRDLLTKVRFPAQVLPATVVLTNLINFLLSLPLMVGLGLSSGVVPSWHIVFLVPVLLVQTFFTLALTYVLRRPQRGLPRSAAHRGQPRADGVLPHPGAVGPQVDPASPA